MSCGSHRLLAASLTATWAIPMQLVCVRKLPVTCVRRWLFSGTIVAYSINRWLALVTIYRYQYGESNDDTSLRFYRIVPVSSFFLLIINFVCDLSPLRAC